MGEPILIRYRGMVERGVEPDFHDFKLCVDRPLAGGRIDRARLRGAARRLTTDRVQSGAGSVLARRLRWLGEAAWLSDPVARFGQALGPFPLPGRLR